MNEQQESMAEFILQTISERDGCMNNSDLDRLFINKYGETVSARKDRFYVKSQLEEEYRLIRTKNALVLLSDNGHTAKRIGFHQYLAKLYNNKRLDIKLKQLEFACKMLAIMKEAPLAILSLIEAVVITGLLMALLL